MNPRRSTCGSFGLGTLGTVGTPSVVNGKQRPQFAAAKWGRREFQQVVRFDCPNVPIMHFQGGDTPNQNNHSVIPNVPSVPSKDRGSGTV